MRIAQKFFIVLAIISGLHHQPALPAQAFYENPFTLAVTIAGTVGLSKLWYDIAKNGTFFAFVQTLEQMIKTRLYRNKIKVGLLKIWGDIDNGSEIDECAKWLEQLNDDDSIKGLIVHIESGGGWCGLGHFLYQEIKKVAERKPVVVFTTFLCQSMAYEIACAGNWIIASDMAEVGHIGVFRQMKHFANTINSTIDGDEGEVEHEIIKSGKYKLAGNSYQPLTDEERKYFQQLNDQQYAIFCQTAARERNLNLQDKEHWADGQIFIALQAKELGLIDQVGSWTDAKEKIKELIKEQNPKLLRKFEIELV